MENEDPIVADHRVDVMHERAPPRQRTAKNAMKVARGGVQSTNSFDNETAPLLGRPSGEDGGRDDSSDNLDSSQGEWVDDEYSQWDSLPWYRRPSAYWLLIPFIFTAFAFGGILVPKINLILSLICREYYSDRAAQDPTFRLLDPGLGEVDDQCRIPEVTARVATFSLWGSTISGVLSAIIAPKLGALSDRYGRRKIMMITNAGSFTGEVITIFAAKFPRTFPVNWILFGYFIDGLCGGLVAAMAVSHSYSTDCTPPHRRNVIFGYFHACLFTGIALGPLVAAFIIRWTHGVIVMFYIALACHVAFILLLMFVIPESLSKARQQSARENYQQEQDALGPTSDWISQLRNLNFFAPLKILYPINDPHTPPVAARNLLLLASIDGIIFGTATGAISAIILYAYAHFKMDAETQSYFISLVNISRVSCLIIVLPLLTRIFRGKSSSADRRLQPKTGTDLFDLSIIRLGIFFDIMGFIGYSLATSNMAFIGSGMIASVGGMGSPTLQAALTKHVSPDKIGQLLGGMGLLHAIAKVFGPIVFNTIYALTVKSFDRAIFVVLTTLFAIAWGLSWLVTPGVRLDVVESEYRRRESRTRSELSADAYVPIIT